MGKAIVDPEELRRFACELKRFNNELQQRLSSLQGRWRSLGETWRDQEHKKFADEFEHTARALGQFVEVSNQHIPFLLRKADRIDEYLQQR